MIRIQTQKAEYWGADFSVNDSDIEQLYNYFLETEKPQTIDRLTRVLFDYRIKQDLNSVERLKKDRTVYDPSLKFDKGDQLVFPAMNFAQGTVAEIRDGFNPEEGAFKVIVVEIANKTREFAAEYPLPHALNQENGVGVMDLIDIDTEALFETYGPMVVTKLEQAIKDHPDFLEMAGYWFVESLLAEINDFHLHLSEAVLEMTNGGPLTADEILNHLDLDPGIDIDVQRFSLNYGLIKDERFDDVAGEGDAIWFLKRLEPSAVQEIPGRLRYRPVEYADHILGSQLIALERELDDEWSDIPSKTEVKPVQLALTYPHKWAGTLPLNSRLRPLLRTGNQPRTRVVFLDEATNAEIEGWVNPEGRYIYGLKEWYEENQIPVGGFLTISPGPAPNTVHLGFDSRRPQREWIRLAAVSDNRIQFELKRRSIGCGYDDLLIVGTDVVAAIDALWRRVEGHQRSLASILVDLFKVLSPLTPQNTVHAKTLYSAVNMLLRYPPGPIFSELVANAAFQTVGDHYWIFDRSRWQDGK